MTQLKNISDTDLASHLSDIMCDQLVDTFHILIGASALRNNVKDDNVASRLGQIATCKQNREALILLEAMKRISTKEICGKAREVAETINGSDNYMLSTDMIEHMIMVYAGQVAKAQREICAKQIHNGSTIRNSEMKHAIINAPEPEL